MLHIIQRSIELFFQSINQSNSRSKHFENMGWLKTRLYFTTTRPDTHSVGTTHTKKNPVRMSFPRNGVKGSGVGGVGGVKLNEE